MAILYNASAKDLATLRGLGFTVYEQGGRFIVKNKGGVSKKRIMEDPNYAHTRHNMKVLTLTSKLNKDLRVLFAKPLTDYGKKGTLGLLQKCLYPVVRTYLTDRSALGFVAKASGMEVALKSVSLSGMAPELKGVVHTVVDTNAHDLCVRLACEHFVKISHATATHCRFRLHAGVLRDYAWIEELQSFDALGELKACNTVTSAVYELESMTEYPDLSLPIDKAFVGDRLVLALLECTFYKVSHGKLEPAGGGIYFV